MRQIHMSINIEGAIRNKSFKGFQDDKGNALTERQASDRLRYYLAMGKKFLPLGDCPDFCYQTGCPGHDIPDIIVPDIIPEYALSMRQPWAWLMIHSDKDIENRTWYSDFRGNFLVHAAKTWGEEEQEDREEVMETFGIDIPERLNLGGIEGVIYMKGCVRKSSSRWFNGPFGFELEKPQPLPFVKCLGQRKFFKHGLTRNHFIS